MTTAFLRHLIFHVYRRGSGFLHRFDGACNVKCAAKAGINIHQQRQIAGVGDAFHIYQHVIECGDAQIWQAVRGIGNATAREINRLMADTFRHHGAVRVDGADDLQWMMGFHCQPEFGART
ncbi:Uncharacterised protein [Vibrio cholerae]|nr:Uncharacterised protein [Vibrio cholerae]